MEELPVPQEMLLSAQRNLDFFLKTFYLHFLPDWEMIQSPVTDESEEQRKRRLMSEKESFLQSGLVILFNSAEIYLKALIAEKSVYLLLKEVKDSYKSKSFFDCATLDAGELHKIAGSISGRTLPQRFNDTYEKLRVERNKVIHLGKSNSNEIKKDFLGSFLTLYEEISQKTLIEMCENLFDKTGLSEEDINNSKKHHASTIINIMKTFFPLDEIIKESYKLDNPPRQWVNCLNCSTADHTLATISRAKSLCLACGFKNGV
ncbi:TPA: hypothetical protein N5L59_001493 [Enterobacter hormaechei subsp. steigerwaltii]|nr:hypothetical protein [Enterobacter hormaechei]HAV1777756.1 hypothetical protein [Enterobacter hormaechei subsp. steigerwaltii]HCM9286181.1 hypothetical protein [Enterobacter hormaechei subsp. steigerwaltii]